MRPRQTLVLGLILLVPVLAFLFLKSFGTNRYALPTYLPDHVDSTQVEGTWQRDTVFHQIGDFRLPAQSGREVSQAELADKGLYVASFFETSSADYQRLNTQLMRVQEKFRREPRVRMASFSINPTQDSVAALSRYAEQYGAIAGKWFFLTGDKTSLNKLATQEFRLTPAADASSQLPHSQRVFLVDKDYRVRGIYDGTSEKEINRLMTEIEVLLYTYDHE
ncbi:SCO family protein [Hymenobacter taeanensis]|uniref:SCO family protein n=1 Tax=Hymenobacter taeanensis TaxID=2735321 RepID=A0A6M6BCQ5_9BACT|nr:MULTISPECIES: SCO family protein [Hymenobacter]QJX45752.1 SCO family protein [Hymenobacter taeanensis]UOQ79592.1 SCO family protein [Hymenobacter sp. 5414T-23]